MCAKMNESAGPSVWGRGPNVFCYMFGLSKERPILDDHPKAHIHEIRRESILCIVVNAHVIVVSL